MENRKVVGYLEQRCVKPWVLCSAILLVVYTVIFAGTWVESRVDNSFFEISPFEGLFYLANVVILLIGWVLIMLYCDEYEVCYTRKTPVYRNGERMETD